MDSMRHVAIYDPNQYATKRIALIGVGTIGSHLAHILARMQVPMTMYDHDTIEPHNLATQSYGAADVGQMKVDVVLAQVNSLGSEVIHEAVGELFAIKDATATYDLIVSAVDSIAARKEIGQMLVDADIPTPIVDGRVGAEQGEVYYFENATAWLEQLPEEGDTDPCGARFTAYTAFIVAGFMANNIKKFLMKQTVPARILYDAYSSSFIKE